MLDFPLGEGAAVELGQIGFSRGPARVLFGRLCGQREPDAMDSSSRLGKSLSLTAFPLAARDCSFDSWRTRSAVRFLVLRNLTFKLSLGERFRHSLPA